MDWNSDNVLELPLTGKSNHILIRLSPVVRSPIPESVSSPLMMEVAHRQSQLFTSQHIAFISIESHVIDLKIESQSVDLSYLINFSQPFCDWN